jgi:hypothetical protein
VLKTTCEYCVNGVRIACVPGTFEAGPYSVDGALYHRSIVCDWIAVNRVLSSGITE